MKRPEDQLGQTSLCLKVCLDKEKPGVGPKHCSRRCRHLCQLFVPVRRVSLLHRHPRDRSQRTSEPSRFRIFRCALTTCSTVTRLRTPVPPHKEKGRGEKKERKGTRERKKEEGKEKGRRERKRKLFDSTPGPFLSCIFSPKFGVFQ